MVPLRLTSTPVGLTVKETADPLTLPLTLPTPEHGVSINIMPPVTTSLFWIRNPVWLLGALVLPPFCRLICQFPEIDPDEDALPLLLPHPLRSNGRASRNAILL